MNRKILSAAICALIIVLLFQLTALAQTPITITHQPQNSSFPENASAYWSVEADGEDLIYDWFIVYNGVAYNTKKSFSENHPWQEGVIGDGYGSNDEGNLFFINGIGTALNGAEIYCVVSDGTYSVTSSAAHISVGASASPPEIVVPASVEIEKDKILKLSCKATAPNNDRIVSYLWYETTTGELKDIVAIGAKEGYQESNSILVCDTTQLGTRYYVCAVKTAKGGIAYSSVIPVTVKKAQPKAEKPPAATDSPNGIDTQNADTEHPPTSSENISAKANTTDATTQISESRGLSPLTVIWIALGGVIVIGGATAAVLIAKRKKSDIDK